MYLFFVKMRWYLSLDDGQIVTCFVQQLLLNLGVLDTAVLSERITNPSQGVRPKKNKRDETQHTTALRTGPTENARASVINK